MKQKNNKTKIVFLMLAMLMLSILSATTVMAGAYKTPKYALCYDNQTTGICNSTTSKFIVMPFANDINYCIGLAEGTWANEDSVQVVSMGNVQGWDYCRDNLYGTILDSFINGRYKSQSGTQNSTHMKLSEIKGTNDNKVVYDTEITITLSELNITYTEENVTYWNGTANVTELKNVSSSNVFANITEDMIDVNVDVITTADEPAIVTFETNQSIPPVVLKDGAMCNSHCENTTFNITTGELGFHVTNFSTYETSSNSNVFAVYEPTKASCEEVFIGIYSGCTGRYGLAINMSYVASLGEDDACSGVYGNWDGIPSNTKVIVSGSNEYMTAVDIVDGYYCDSLFLGTPAYRLGRIKGQAHHNALMNGTTTTSLVIDSPHAMIEYDASSEVNMSQVLDMAVDTIIANDPFQLADELISVDDTNYPTLDKSARITFKNVESGTATILKDGSPCPSNVCTDTNYNNQEETLSTDVTGFSTYTLGSAYTEDDVAPAFFDITGKVIVGFGSIAGLFGLFMALIIGLLIYNGLIKKK